MSMARRKNVSHFLAVTSRHSFIEGKSLTDESRLVEIVSRNKSSRRSGITHVKSWLATFFHRAASWRERSKFPAGERLVIDRAFGL
jgi:hypothetical protein